MTQHDPDSDNTFHGDESLPARPSPSAPHLDALLDDCRRLRRSLHAFAEGECSVKRRSAIEVHIAACTSCCRRVRRFRAERAWILSNAVRGPVLPARFASRLIAKLSVTPPAPATEASVSAGATAPSRGGWRQLVLPLASSVAAAAALVVVLSLDHPGGADAPRYGSAGPKSVASAAGTDKACHPADRVLDSSPGEGDGPLSAPGIAAAGISSPNPLAPGAGVDFCAFDSFIDTGLCPALDGDYAMHQAVRADVAAPGGRRYSGARADRRAGSLVRLRPLLASPHPYRDAPVTISAGEPFVSAGESLSDDPCGSDLNRDGRADINDVAHYCQVLMGASLPSSMREHDAAASESDCADPCT